MHIAHYLAIEQYFFNIWEVLLIQQGSKAAIPLVWKASHNLDIPYHLNT